MTRNLQDADDSCSTNQTVGSTGVNTPPARLEKLNISDGSGQSQEPSLVVGQPGADVNLDPEEYFPEGGTKAWLVVFGSFCAMLGVYGLINTSGVFESYFAENQLKGYSTSTIGWIFSVYLFVVFFAGVQVGPIFDRYGPRLLVAAGSVLCVASQLLLGLCTEYYQIILTYSILGGIGGALLNVPAYGCIAHYFKVRRAMATGFAATAGGIGGVVFPLVLQRLLPQVGFAWSTRIVGFILLGLCVPANLLLTSRLPPSDKMLSIMPDWTIFQSMKFTLTCAGIWLLEWGLFVPVTFIVSYAADHGQDANAAYILAVWLNLGSVFGRFAPGFLADKIGRFNVIVLTIALCVISPLVLWLPAGNSRSMLTAFAVIFGFVSGSNLGLYPVCLGQLCDARDMGRTYATATMVASFGTLSSLPIGGALQQVGTPEQGWSLLIVFSALSYALAMSCFLAVRVLAVSWKVNKIY